jgi:hypothetical protein
LRILLQRTESKKFLAPDGKWVEDHQDALAFNHILKACEYAREHKLRGVQVLLKFRTNDMDVPLRLGPT